ncbi:MAG: hypothetical protein Q8O24_00325, partial [Gallionellaceae bacterium]|nr:hypothetical protein [Gallionellaceae bacterium]
MNKISFEYCSLHYLNWWLTHDRDYCQALDGNDKEAKLAAFTKMAGLYSVARNLPTEFDIGEGLDRYEPILNIVDALAPSTFEGNDVIAKITEIEGLISKAYGGNKKLSLT